MAAMLFGENRCKAKRVFFYASVTAGCDFSLDGSLSLQELYESCTYCALSQFFLWFPACEHPTATPKVCLSNSSATHWRGTLGAEGFFTFPSAWLWSHHIWKATSSTNCPSWTAALRWAAGEQVPPGTRRVQIQKVRLWIKVAKKFPLLSKHLTPEKSRAFTYTSVSYRRLRLRDGPTCIQLSKEQVTRKFGQCTHTHR